MQPVDAPCEGSSRPWEGTRLLLTAAGSSVLVLRHCRYSVAGQAPILQRLTSLSDPPWDRPCNVVAAPKVPQPRIFDL